MSNKKTIPRICKTCGKVFLAWDNAVKRGNGNFCSHSCKGTKKANSNWKNGSYSTPQWRAYRAIQRAVRDGTLVRQPCEQCRSTVFVEAHHDNYDKPLEVHWLCHNHHMKEHARRRTANA